MTNSNDNTAGGVGMKAAGAITTLAAATFLLGALLHAGVEVPLGVATLAEPRILPAVIVEGLCAVALSAGAYGLLAGRRWGPGAARAASVVGVVGVLIGTTALALGAGPRTQFNDLLHVFMLVLLLTALGFPSPSRRCDGCSASHQRVYRPAEASPTEGDMLKLAPMHRVEDVDLPWAPRTSFPGQRRGAATLTLG